jgi:hypothetical protein
VNEIKYFVTCVFVCCVLFVYCFEVQIVEMAYGSAASSSDSVGVRRSQKVKNRFSKASKPALVPTKSPIKRGSLLRNYFLGVRATGT